MSVSPNVRIIAPTGKIGYVPEEKLPEAIAAGATVLTPAKMRELRQAIFMEHAISTTKSRSLCRRGIAGSSFGSGERGEAQTSLPSFPVRACNSVDPLRLKNESDEAEPGRKVKL